MALTGTPSTQLQGINTQGIDVNKNHCTVHIDWTSPATNLYFDPVNPTVTITLNGNPYTLQKEMMPLSRQDDTVGVWIHSFLTDGMTAGTYVFTYSGVAPDTTTVTKTLSFTAKEQPVEQYFINVLRNKLWDKRASRYFIDDNMRTRYVDGELFSFLDDARLAISQAPPSPTDIPWGQAYSEIHEQIVTGGFIFALEAAGIFELAQKMTYQDELTLNLDRTAYWQNAQSLRQQWWNSVLMWKRDRAFHITRAIGLTSGRYPVYYSRVLSISVANAQNFFG